MKIIFNSKEHSYESEKIRYTSVTTRVKKYENYDREYWSEYKAIELIFGKDHFRSLRNQMHYKAYDKEMIAYMKTRISPTDFKDALSTILGQWSVSSNIATKKGNDYHDFKEKQAFELGYSENPFTNEDFSTIQSMDIYTKDGVEYREPTYEKLWDLKDGFHPELLIWDNESATAGQSDKIYIKTVGDKRLVWVDDYKTNKKIDTYSFFKNKMKAPLAHLDDVNYNHYRLQLSIYAWMMEKAGYTIAGTRFTHLNKPYEFDYLKKEVELIMPIYTLPPTIAKF